MTADGRQFPNEMDRQLVIDLRRHDAVVDLDGNAVPFLDLTQQHRTLEAEILAAWRSILQDAAFIGGSAVESFEESLADFLGVTHAIGVGNGTDAIMLALKALELEAGDEVITAANTFFATIEAITHAGGTPVLVDVQPDTGTIDPNAIRAAITPRTRFIVPVHLYGQPADMDEIMGIASEHGLLVLEDNAQAMGSRYGDRRTGSIGHAAATSFYPGKNLGGAGDGGAVTTNDAEVARRTRMYANHGSEVKYDHIVVGYNSRLDALQAAALSIKLKHLDDWNAKRRNVAVQYGTLMDQLDFVLPAIASGRTHVFHLYVVRVHNRDAVRAQLKMRGVATGLHYPTPIHLTRASVELGRGRGSFPNAERWADAGLSLPMYPEMSEQQIDTVAAAMAEVLGESHVLARNTA